jgi:hypothetical protein
MLKWTIEVEKYGLVFKLCFPLSSFFVIKLLGDTLEGLDI